MSDSEADEDLKRAIALSLQTSSPVPIHGKNLIDLTISDNENDNINNNNNNDDDDLDAPVTTHFKFSQAQHVPNTSTGIEVGTSSQVSSQPSATILNSLNPPNLASKKRKASVSSPASSLGEHRQPKASRSGSTLCGEPDERHRNKSTGRKSTENGADHALDKLARRPANPKSDTDIGTSVIYGKLPIDVQSGGDVSGAGIQFPRGIVKKTWADGFPREDDIKIEEVLQHSTLQHAVLSAFQVEPGWVMSKLLTTTKVIWVLQAKTEAEFKLVA
ncbi:hypothetical protein EYC80_000026 [Monilinia laxa]|uniref:Uncharacterized protein n=1 Tax=Monilinia laxa TaxID=61186 RepID=A0A5N6K9G8_MONLA|nr:hypothetical protein EYC80_000026 [Monilinia laxa]